MGTRSQNPGVLGNHFMEKVQPQPTGLLKAESITDLLGSVHINTFIFQVTVKVKR